MKYFWLVIVILIIVLAWQLWPEPPLEMPPTTDDDGQPNPPPNMPEVPPGPDSNGGGPFPPVPNAGNTVTYLDTGYRPQELRVKVGTTVFFQNGSIAPVWTASAMHPTHTVYPGSDINKCTTALANTIFDSCQGIAPGDSWSFTFTQMGQWNYHNHLNASHFGKIVVEN